MKLRTALVLAVGLLLAVIAPLARSDKQDDRDVLQGTWTLVSVEANGSKLPMDDLKKGQLVIKGEEYKFTLGLLKLEFTFKTDPTKSPKEIDLTFSAGPNKGKTLRGIYVLAGDNYKICRHIDPEKPRPRQFVTAPDSGLIVVEWQRGSR